MFNKDILVKFWLKLQMFIHWKFQCVANIIQIENVFFLTQKKIVSSKYISFTKIALSPMAL